MSYTPPGWSEIEARLLKARVDGKVELAKKLELLSKKCEHCGAIWEKGKREYHRENCSL